MNEVWKSLRNRNERFEKRRRKEQSELTVVMLHTLPAIPAIFTSDVIRISFVERLNDMVAFGGLAEFVGSALFGYAIVLAYMFVIWFGSITVYRKYDWLTKLVTAWIAWAWFYYMAWYREDIVTAFLVAIVVSLFTGVILGTLFLGYRKIREGMFLGGSDDV